jgi:hypothetical protein
VFSRELAPPFRGGAQIVQSHRPRLKSDPCGADRIGVGWLLYLLGFWQRCEDILLWIEAIDHPLDKPSFGSRAPQLLRNAAMRGGVTNECQLLRWMRGFDGAGVVTMMLDLRITEIAAPRNFADWSDLGQTPELV